MKSIYYISELRTKGYVFIALVTLSFVIYPPVFNLAYAIELYSKDESPFGISNEQWIGQWWFWWINIPTNPADNTIVDLKQDGCIMNKTGSMVMLMETTVGSYHQICDISSKQGLIVPLWTGWCDSGVPSQRDYSYAQLTKCARETANLGRVKSSLTIDGAPAANLDETTQFHSGSESISYTKDKFDNILEINTTKGFDLKIPENSHIPSLDVSPDNTKWRAGAQGWFVFLKPLSLGKHEISYSTGVNEDIKNPEGAGLGGFIQDKEKSVISYTLNVK